MSEIMSEQIEWIEKNLSTIDSWTINDWKEFYERDIQLLLPLAKASLPLAKSYIEARKLLLAADHLLMAATGPDGGPTDWNKTRDTWMKLTRQHVNENGTNEQIHELEQ